ncbi:DEAD/DEAH box helicase [Neisseria meningitidis]|nr:DEAD/DEAH box helicase [Neisseria meningitidis]
MPQDAVTINKRRRNYAVRITPPSRRRQRAIITDCPLKKSDPAFVAESEILCTLYIASLRRDD